VAQNENFPRRVAHLDCVISASKARALATEAALATSLDASPAVLVSIYDQAQRYSYHCRRSA
jgi:hypothetical protein